MTGSLPFASRKQNAFYCITHLASHIILTQETSFYKHEAELAHAGSHCEYGPSSDLLSSLDSTEWMINVLSCPANAEGDWPRNCSSLGVQGYGFSASLVP